MQMHANYRWIQIEFSWDITSSLRPDVHHESIAQWMGPKAMRNDRDVTIPWRLISVLLFFFSLSLSFSLFHLSLTHFDCVCFAQITFNCRAIGGATLSRQIHGQKSKVNVKFVCHNGMLYRDSGIRHDGIIGFCDHGIKLSPHHFDWSTWTLNS